MEGFGTKKAKNRKKIEHMQYKHTRYKCACVCVSIYLSFFLSIEIYI